MPAASWRIMPARSIRRCEAISASFGVSRRLGRKNRERRMDSSLRGSGSETGTSAETQGREFGGGGNLGRNLGRYFFAVCGGQPRDKSPRIDYQCLYAVPKPPISFHEISGKRSKSWEDTRTRKAASL